MGQKQWSDNVPAWSGQLTKPTYRRIVLRCCSVPQAKPSPDYEYRISLRPHPVGHPSSSTQDSASRAVPSSIRVRRDGYREAGEWQQAGRCCGSPCSGRLCRARRDRSGGCLRWQRGGCTGDAPVVACIIATLRGEIEEYVNWRIGRGSAGSPRLAEHLYAGARPATGCASSAWARRCPGCEAVR
jgi:hypothetical protein